MKKILSISLSAVMVITMAACSENPSPIRENNFEDINIDVSDELPIVESVLENKPFFTH